MQNGIFHNSTFLPSPAIRTKHKTKKALKQLSFCAFSQGAGKSFLQCKKDSACFRFAENASILTSTPPLAWRFARFLQLSPPLKTEMHRRSGAFLFQGQEDSNPRPTVLEWLSDCGRQSGDCQAFTGLL